eukprot:11037811-Alexandrium_andersonii.AAC.1
MDQHAHRVAQGLGLVHSFLQGVGAASNGLGNTYAVPAATAVPAAVHEAQTASTVGDRDDALGRGGTVPSTIELHAERAAGRAG